MRIVSGRMGGRRFTPPSKMPHTRPTTDIAKEGLFNVLQHQLDFDGLKTLDLFGGTGSISYELASRGVGDMTIVEKDPVMYSFIKKTVTELQIDNCKVEKADVFRFLEHCSEKYDLIFAGPPYALVTIDELPKRIFELGLLNENGWFILEHTPRNNYEDMAHFTSSKNYGTTVFSFFVNTGKMNQ